MAEILTNQNPITIVQASKANAEERKKLAAKNREEFLKKALKEEAAAGVNPELIKLKQENEALKKALAAAGAKNKKAEQAEQAKEV